MEKIQVGIAMLTLNYLEWTKKCLEAFEKYTRPGSYKMIIIDNGSTDGTVEYLKQSKWNVIYKPENIGVTAAMNEIWSMQMKDPDLKYVVRMHNDIIVTQGWLSKMVDIIESDETIGRVGLSCLVGSHLVNLSVSDINDMCIQFAEKKRGRANLDPSIIRKTVIEEVGLLDEKYGKHECEDCDHNKRIEEAGYSVLGVNDAVVGHGEAVTRVNLPNANDDMLAARKYWSTKYPGVNMQNWNRSIYRDVKFGNIPLRFKGV